MGAFGPNYGGNYTRESIAITARRAYTLQVDLCANDKVKTDLCVAGE